ncbi:WG repeat-containing protein [Ruminococcus sp.]|uniref:WG repeat-containing protein n=1 Tax=Ruminococcus sp. TaxID=41978 RepID=UPI0025EA8DCF|nr:WG repeat-containing protein [Ruminococcus sp.]MCR4638462.1 hypothetical protein [Ruminococcus sp.]
MNKHTRLIVSLLFIGIIVLAVAITRFYSRTEKSAVSSGSQTVIEKRLNFDSYGNRAFQNSDGLVGIIDGNDRVIVSPEWQSIKFTNNKDRCIASKRIRGNELFGCIDYEGNIVVPFVYSKIDLKSSAERVFYIADTADKKSSVVYNSDFTPCFSRAWDSCEYENGELTVTAGSGTYTYIVKNSVFIFKKATVNGNVLDLPYTVEVNASGLTVPMIEKISKNVGKYIEFAYQRDEQAAEKLLSEMDISSKTDFSVLFPNEKKVTSKKLLGLSDITVTSAPSSGKLPQYMVTLKALTGITYKNEENKPKRLKGEYEAVIMFTGTSEDDFKAVSGSFLKDKPDYPAPAPESQPDTQPETGPQIN